MKQALLVVRVRSLIRYWLETPFDRTPAWLARNKRYFDEYQEACNLPKREMVSCNEAECSPNTGKIQFCFLCKYIGFYNTVSKSVVCENAKAKNWSTWRKRYFADNVKIIMKTSPKNFFRTLGKELLTSRITVYYLLSLLALWCTFGIHAEGNEIYELPQTREVLRLFQNRLETTSFAS